MPSLTPEQSQILAALETQRQAAVYGCAGSGKVLLLCRNPYLAESLRQRVQGSSVEVHAHQAASRAKSLLYIVSPFSVLEPQRKG